jgi:hypothetical protein
MKTETIGFTKIQCPNHDKIRGFTTTDFIKTLVNNTNH